MEAGGRFVIDNADLQKDWSIYPVGDIHLWGLGCDEKRLDATLAEIKRKPRSLWVGLGDYWDLIAWHDKRFDPDQIRGKARGAYFEGMIKSALQLGEEKFGPIKDKCIGLCLGNHEFQFEVRHGFKITENLCENLGVKYLGYRAFRDIVFKNGNQEVSLRLHLFHGAGAAATKGGKINRLEKTMKQVVAEVVIMGHVHEALDDVVIRLAANNDCTKLVQVAQLGVVSGTFLRTYPQGTASTYGERAGYDPAPLGSPCITFNPSTRKMSVDRPMGKE